MTPLDDPRVRWGAPAAAIGTVVFAAAIVGGLVLTRSILRATGIDPYALSFWATLALDGVAVGIVIVVVRMRGSGDLAADVGLRVRPVDLGLGPGVGLAAKVVAVLGLAIVLLATRVDLTSLRSNIPFDRASVWSWLLVGIVGCVAAPFAEELLFRGLVLRGVQRSILRRGDAPGGPSRARRATAAGVAIVVSAVLFAGFHLYEAISPLMVGVLASQILVIGVVNGVLTVFTGRLGPAILSHVANNAIAFALLAAFPQLAGSTP